MSANSPTTWGDAVAELLEASGIRGASLAAELGTSRAQISMFLRGTRRPSSKWVDVIDNAVAKLIAGKSERTRYWIVNYLKSFGNESTRGADHSIGAIDGARLVLWQIVGYLRPSFVGDAKHMPDKIVGAIGELDSRRRRDLSNALNRIYRTRLLRHIVGAADRDTLFDEVSAVCRRYGLDLTPWLLPVDDPGRRRTEATEEFARAVGRAVSKLQVDDITERLEAEAEIFGAFHIVMQYTADMEGFGDLHADGADLVLGPPVEDARQAWMESTPLGKPPPAKDVIRKLAKR
jgi:transcriptional regulator with XRE-family HTH domain